MKFECAALKAALMRRRGQAFALCVTALLAVFAAAGLLVSVLGGGGETAEATPAPPETPASPLVFMHPLLPPVRRSPPDDYRLFRPRRSVWGAEEAERWFTPPDAEMMEQLHRANSRLIDGILEAAP